METLTLNVHCLSVPALHSVFKNVGIQVMLMISPVNRSYRWHLIFFRFRAAHAKQGKCMSHVFYTSNYVYVPTKGLCHEDLHHESGAEHDGCLNERVRVFASEL